MLTFSSFLGLGSIWLSMAAYLMKPEDLSKALSKVRFVLYKWNKKEEVMAQEDFSRQNLLIHSDN